MNNVQEFSQESLVHNIIAQKSSSTGTTVYYVGVYKESESGLMYNERMLVV
jgi:hypothetical protein